MKNLLFGLLLASALGALTYVFIFYENCKEPSEFKILATTLSCTVELINEDIAAEACKAKGQAPDCQLTEEEDSFLVEELIDSKVRNCIISEFKKDNYCTDKVK